MGGWVGTAREYLGKAVDGEGGVPPLSIQRHCATNAAANSRLNPAHLFYATIPPPPHSPTHQHPLHTHTIIINAHTTCPPMSERGNFRGRGGSGRGGGGEHSRGGRGGGGRGGGGQHAEKPKKENILDLTKYMDKEITVKFNGGREGP